MQPGDREIAELAARQHGVVGYRQLREMGLGRDAIKKRAATGRLHRVYHGAYAVGHSLLTVRGRWMAATLSFGPGAVLSHQDGGSLWGVMRSSSPRIHVTVPGRSKHSREGIRVHSVRGIAWQDCGTIDDIPVTALPRTLLDLAEVLRPRALERAIEEAERLRLFDLRAIEDVLDRSPGRRGRRALADAVSGALPEAQHTKSDLELLFLALCRDEGLPPPPAMNAVVAGYEVDAHWPGTDVIVELDSWDFHRTRAAFERDRARDLALRAAGYRVVRLTWRQLTEEPAEITATLRALLGSSRTRRARGPGALARA
jgi:hypothetical protein